MKRMILTVAYVMMVGGAGVLAQTPDEQARIEEARARLEAKQAQKTAAASQPSTISQKDADELRRQVAQLRAENEALRREVAALKATPKEAPIVKAPAKPGTKAPAGKKIVTPEEIDARLDKVNQWREKLIGMTVDEAYRSAGALVRPGSVAPNKPMLSGADDGAQIYTMNWDHTKYVFTVEGGKIVAFEKR